MLGAGAEYAFGQNWSAKLEYNYLRFGSISPTFTTTGGLAVAGTGELKLNTHIVKAGLNYRFTTF
jgi:outer membrane immunogenic protein